MDMPPRTPIMLTNGQSVLVYTKIGAPIKNLVQCIPVRSVGIGCMKTAFPKRTI